jgi:hypothetical protein
MRIPTTTVSFEEEGYTNENGDSLWLKVPRSVLEGDVHEIQEQSRAIEKAGNDASPNDVRSMNIRVLDFVTDWNFDDSNGIALPTLQSIGPADTKDEEIQQRRIAVAAQIPVEVIQKTVASLTNQELSKRGS